MGPVELAEPEQTKVELVCLRQPGECESVVDWGAGEPFRHVMLAPGTDQRCPACGERRRFQVKRAVADGHRFALGALTATPGFQVLAAEHDERLMAAMLNLVARHVRGDWGEVDPQDRKINEAALGTDAQPQSRQRLLSSYRYANQKVWVITEAGRHNTTVLLPSEY